MADTGETQAAKTEPKPESGEAEGEAAKTEPKPEAGGEGEAAKGEEKPAETAVAKVVHKHPDGHEPFKYDYATRVGPWAMLDTSQGFPESQMPTEDWFLEVAAVALNLVVNSIVWVLDPNGKPETLHDVIEKMGWDKVKLDVNLGDVEGLLSAGTAILQALAEGGVKTPELVGLIKLAAKTLKDKEMKCPSRSMELLKPSIEIGPHGRPKSLDDYNKLFKTIKIPHLSTNYFEDKIFADQRVAGFNPVVIRGVTNVPKNFPVTDRMLANATMPSTAASFFKRDTLKKAGKEGRLYLADYSVLVDSVMGCEPAGPKYIFAPLALFALPPGVGSRRLVPVAIQCGQDPKVFPVHTPEDSDLWARAKTTVQLADAHYHELISHLAGTHLLMEPFVISTHNNLPVTHPIGHLLLPHFEGTLFINFGAVTVLLSDNGGLSKLLAPTIEASIKVSVEYLTQEDFFNAHMLPAHLKARKVMSDDLYYPYRDDALAVWYAINSWVTNYVNVFYKDDKAVEDDEQLQAWAKELVSENGGRLKGFGEVDGAGKTQSGKVTTVAYLVEALTMVLFTASAGHAAFNYAQPDMSYVPATPAAGYRSMPQSAQQATIMPSLDQYPPLEMAGQQLNLLQALGGVYYTKLGHYNEYWPQNQEVGDALQNYKDALAEVSAKMKAANEARKPKYTYLLPERIPQSINI